MAEIYGRLTGRAGVCSSTLGPGAINLLLGTADAPTRTPPRWWRSPRRWSGSTRIYKDSHQGGGPGLDVHPGHQMGRHHPHPRGRARDAAQGLQGGPDRATGRRLPVRARGRRAAARPRGAGPAAHQARRGPDEPSPAQVERAVAVLEASRRPIVLAGHGATRGHAAPSLRAFAEQLGLPVATTFLGKGRRVPRTTTPTHWGRSASWATTTSTSASTTPTSSSATRRLRVAGVRPGPHQPARHHAHHPPGTTAGRSGRPLRRGGRRAGRHRPFAHRPGRGQHSTLRAGPSRLPHPGPAGRRARPRRSRRQLPAQAATDCGRHPGRAGPLGHRAGRHRRREDVDGPALPDLRAQHLHRLQRALHHGLRPPWRHRTPQRGARAPGPGRGGRRCLLDERAGDRDGHARAHRPHRADLAGRRLRADQVEDAARDRARRRHRPDQPRLRAVRRRASAPGATGCRRRATCCRCCRRRWPPTPSRSSPARSTTPRTCGSPPPWAS